MKRTDLAIEAHDRRAKKCFDGNIPGVSFEAWKENDISCIRIQVLNEIGTKEIGKPIGTYLSMELDSCIGSVRAEASRQLTDLLRTLLPCEGEVMVVGLGNRAVTADALGPRTVEGILVTRHLIKEFAWLRSVSALCPGVEARTGIDSSVVVEGIIERVRPSCVIVVDALAAADAERIGRTIQLSDAGLSPGSGVGNHKLCMSRDTLGIPVLSLGIPTVCDADAAGSGRIITGADIDAVIKGGAGMLSHSLNCALQINLTEAEIAQFVL